MASTDGSLKGRVTRQGEEALGKLAQDLLQNPVVHGTLSTVFETRERASRIQEVAMGALNLPSASDLARLTRRLRSVSQRIEGLEDGLDRVVERLDQMRSGADVGARLDAIERSLERVERSLGADQAPAPAQSETVAPGPAKPASRSARKPAPKPAPKQPRKPPPGAGPKKKA